MKNQVNGSNSVQKHRFKKQPAETIFHVASSYTLITHTFFSFHRTDFTEVELLGHFSIHAIF